MDTHLFKTIEQRHTPKINPLIANGLAVEHLRLAEQYIDRVWRCAAPGFPEGFEYGGYQVCSPQEEYAEVTRKRNNKRNYEIARSDIYLVKFIFYWQGKELPPRYMYLPYVGDAGKIHLRGSEFAVAPVLADPAISIGTDSIFIPLTRDKLTFERLVQHYYVNGQRETVNVVWSNLYRRSQKAKKMAGRPTIHGNCTLMHYLMCKYGLAETFQRFAGVEVQVGWPEEINEKNYPPKSWKICQSTQIKPRGVREKYYTGSNLRLAVRKRDYTSMVASMIGAVFYIVDHFPHRVEPEFVNSPRLWRILLGHFIFATQDSEGRLVEGVEEHLASLDEYMDVMARENLREEGVYVDDVYQLFAHIIETFPDRVMQQGDGVASMYGKRLTVLRYMLQPLINSIFKFMFSLQANANKRPLTENHILSAMNRMLKQERIMEINHDHGEIGTISTPGDNKLLKVTSALVLQANSTGSGRRKAKSNTMDPSKLLHASIAEVGQYSNLPKSDPTGRSRVNPCVQIGADGMIERDPSLRPLIDAVQEKIKR